MSLVAKYAQGLKGLKLKELVPYSRKYAQENLQPEQLRTKAETGLDAYKRKYIDTGSPKPLFDVLIYGFFFSYAIAWPQEYKHYKHEQEMKLKGEAH